MNKTAFVTGATTGIGRATAFRLAGMGYNLILAARRKELLDLVRTDLLKQFTIKVKALEMDVRNIEEARKSIFELEVPWRNIDLLVNNAGLAAGLDYFHEASFNDWCNMLDTNVKGLLNVSQAVAQIMVPKKKGHIINISSIAGTQVYEKGNVYSASKHAVDAITKGMQIDLLKHHIKVTSISPGAVKTEFSTVRFKGDQKKADRVYSGYQPLLPENIADIIVFVASQPDHVNINDLEVTPLAQANVWYLNREI